MDSYDNIIHADVRERVITLREPYVRPTRRNQGRDYLSLHLDNEWQADHRKRVTFYSENPLASVQDWWDGESPIEIPAELILCPNVKVTLVELDEDGTERLGTYEMPTHSAIRCIVGGHDEGAEPSEKTRDIIVRAEEAVDEAKALTESLEASEGDREKAFQQSQQSRETAFHVSEANRQDTFQATQETRSRAFAQSMGEWDSKVDSKAAQASQAASDARAAANRASSMASYAEDAADELKRRADAGEFDGAPGHSPVITATKEGNDTTLLADGVVIGHVMDGADGKDAPPYDDSAIQARMSALEEQLSKQDTSTLWGVSFAGSSNTQGVQRLYAAASLGMLSYATETDSGKYPFDAADPWQFTYWLVRYDADGYPVKVASMTMDGAKSPGWDENAAMLDRFVEFPNAWFMRDDNAGVYLVSSVEREGFTRFYAKPDGSEPDMLPLIPCYKMGNATGTYSASTGTGCSRPGMNPHWGTFSQHRTLQQTASKRGHGGATWFENWKQVMCYVELASRDVQGVLDYNGKALPGFSGGCYTNNASYNAVATTAANTNVVQVVNASNYFAVGQTVNVCQGWITSDKVLTRRITAISGNSVTLDGDPFSVEAGWFLYNMDWQTGHADNLKGHTGAIVLSSNRYGMRWRGIEDLWAGSAEDVIDLRLTCAGSDASAGYDVWYCYDALKAHMAADAPSADYALTGMNLPRADGYIKLVQEYGGDARLVMPLVVTGASATTYMADYCWTNSDYADNRSVRSGNYWYDGSPLGVFSRYCNHAASAGARYFCARLFLEP